MNKLRLNHLILLTGVMLIALFTSATKAMAETDYTIEGNVVTINTAVTING